MLINDHVQQCCLTNSAPQACLSIQHQTPQLLPSPQPMRSLTFEEPKGVSGSRSRGGDSVGGVGNGGCVGDDGGCVGDDGGGGVGGGGVGGGFGGSGGGGSCSCGASVSSEAGSTGVDASSLVRCPICAVEMSLAELNAHLDAGDCCPGGTTDAAGAAATESAVAEPITVEELAAGSVAESAVGEAAVAAAAEAAAAVAAAAAAEAEAAVAAEAEAAAAAAGRGTARRLRLEQLGKEMRCPICFDLFDRPHSLPCQHSFCYECVMGCFRATSKMECPLCKAPTWRRQVTTNHTLAGIVQAFEALQEQAADSPVRGAERTTAASPAASRASPASTASPTF